ncbi:hypothetical protein [Tahibacter amnicola]|uniref:Chalcone isomerase-like protein n=1 Tax=Tahibacter amnicola TaxID=2976241 RepID=A0ABY6BMG9_9GAMM|nr:hypothetical protein [Tahibacter amnicola]UXI70250.1 hypothetical protein N4264_11625 [Tahibacter amnicola]
MRFVLTAALLLLVPAAHATCAGDAKPWLTLEIIASEYAGSEAAETVDVSPDGCATIRYGSFDVRAGIYQRQLGTKEFDALAQTVVEHRLADLDTAALETAVANHEQMLRSGLRVDQPALFEVSDGDVTRILINQGGKAQVIEWYALQQSAHRYKEISQYTGLVRFVEQMRAVAAHDGKAKVAEVAR